MVESNKKKRRRSERERESRGNLNGPYNELIYVLRSGLGHFALKSSYFVVIQVYHYVDCNW